MTLALLEHSFLGYWSTDRVFFVSWIFTVILSITLHELGHGWAAIRQGDETPRLTGHMNLNPLTHMGALSLVLLFVAGIAWGSMPVDPTRFRSKYGDAIVSFAGPAVNLVLAFLGLTVLGVLNRFGVLAGSEVGANFGIFLFVFGSANIVLFLLNMIPVPPLDGSRVLASFSRPFRRFLDNPANQGVFFAAAFVVIIVFGKHLFPLAFEASRFWIGLLAGQPV